jgi:hypothetical protein
MDSSRAFDPAPAHPVPPTPAARTLADVAPGAEVRVDAVAPDVRDMLAGLGVYDGADLVCRTAEHFVVVRTAEGLVPLDRGLAARVGVVPREGPAGPSAPPA